jgi:hypothetical protein
MEGVLSNGDIQIVPLKDHPVTVWKVSHKKAETSRGQLHTKVA